MHNFFNTDPHSKINAALVECFEGDHVSHITNPANNRTVAIRRWKRADGSWADQSFTLRFSDPSIVVRSSEDDRLNATNWEQAIRLIYNFLVGDRCDEKLAYYEAEINQAVRDVDIIKLTPTRARISYWLPKSGNTFAWRARTTVGGFHYLRAT